MRHKYVVSIKQATCTLATTVVKLYQANPFSGVFHNSLKEAIP
jgi:hypothetical protein